MSTIFCWETDKFARAEFDNRRAGAAIKDPQFSAAI
jgi:hypothetical protein